MQAFKFAYPGLFNSDEFARIVFSKMPVKMGIFYEYIANVLAVIPGIKPLLNLRIFKPLLNTLVVADRIAI